MPKKAIIIGAGPAGLTAAYELLKRTDIKPILIEKCNQVGGISKTVDYKGNKMDFGPHRFFSKSDRVMNWWTNIMPLHTPKGEDLTISYQNKSRTINTGDFLTSDETDGLPPANSMLVIPRLTRIYFLRQFFAYPIQLSIATLGQLGLGTTIKIVFSYLYARLFPRKPEKSLEDFMINKFGSVLYHIFFKDYTEKVWGMDCNKISAEWGAQRIKGVSLSKAVLHAAKALTKKKKKVDKTDINQKDTETSLIEQFLYPAKGAGAMWEEVAHQVEVMGGKIVSNYDVKQIFTEGDQITGIEALNTLTGQLESLEGDYFISTMPIQELIAGLKGNVPAEVKEVAAGLIYRDFVYAGVLVKKMSIPTPKDSWIYIQERDVTVARMQIYNNWGPYMVADPNTVWLGLEYFCTKGDAIWNLTDEEVEKKAVEELVKMNLVSAEDVLDTKVNRMEKTYPAYFGTYDRFDVIREYLDNFSNLFLVGRNGMHKYNNADHSMLTAMVAVDNITEGVLSKDNLWSINTEQEYHEEKKTGNNEHISMQNSTEFESGNILSQKGSVSSFKDYVLVNKKNKRILLLSLIAIVAQFVIFKYFYPFPTFIHGDSWGYILAAANNSDVNTHMIGYSRFLRLASVFTQSDTVIVAFQFLLSHFAGLFLFFSLNYFHKMHIGAKIILWVFLLLNPLFLYMSNLISSDSIFMSLSMLWFTLLLWLYHKPSVKIILWHTVIIFFAFIFRYNALVYPVISFIIFYIAKIPRFHKLLGLGTMLIPCILFIIYTGNEYKKLTGIWQYSPFSSWQIANNALYTYRFVDSSERLSVPPKFKKLDDMVRARFDSTSNFFLYPLETVKAGTGYMWTKYLPLFRYRDSVLKNDSGFPEHKKWSMMGPFYREYGITILKNYPLHYLKDFIWPNAIKYYAPPTEFLEFYNMGKDTVSNLAKTWFEYPTNKVFVRLPSKRNTILEIYSLIMGPINLMLLCCFIWFLILRRNQANAKIQKTIIITILIWFFNAVFTILSSPAAIRLQAFPIIIETSITVLLLDWLVSLSKTQTKEDKVKLYSNLSPEFSKSITV